MHDWVFAARHCIVDGRPDKGDSRDVVEYRKVASISFDASVRLLAEVMKTLMVDRKVRTLPGAFGAITFGVKSFVASNLWNKTGVCEPVSDVHRRLIEEALRRVNYNLNALAAPHPRAPGAPLKPPVIVYQHQFN